MKIFTDANIPHFPHAACGLTIGNFDGVHLGHVYLLNHLRALLPPGAPIIAYTFSNHPSHALSHLPPIPLIYTMEHKLKILQEKGVDYTLLTTFTKEFAETPYDTFLRRLKEKIPFTKLVLGFGSRFGKNKEGTEEAMRALSKQLDFHVAYLPKLQLDEQPFSSAHIRTLIATAHFSQIERCLGRPYSVYAPLFCKQEHFHIATSGLCLPPSGTYSVSIAYENQIYPASAHVDRHSEQIHIAFPTPLALPSPCFVELFFDF